MRPRKGTLALLTSISLLAGATAFAGSLRFVIPVDELSDIPADANPHVALWIDEGAPEELLEAASEFPLVVDVRVPRDGIVPLRTLDLLRNRRNIEAVVLAVDLCMTRSSEAVLEVGAALGRVARTLEAVRPEIEIGVVPRLHPRDCPNLYPRECPELCLTGCPGLCDPRLLGIGLVVEEAALRAKGRLPLDAILSSCAEDWPSGWTGLARMGADWRGDPRGPERWSSYSVAAELTRLLGPDALGKSPCFYQLRHDYKSLLPPSPINAPAARAWSRPFVGRVFVETDRPKPFYSALAWVSRLLDTADVAFGEEPWVFSEYRRTQPFDWPVGPVRVNRTAALLPLPPRGVVGAEPEIRFETGERFSAALLLESGTGREAMIQVPTTRDCVTLVLPDGLSPDLAILLP